MIRKAVWIDCEAEAGGDDYGCEGQVPQHLGCDSVAEARRMARRDGWKRSGGRDICPPCWGAGK